MKRAISLSTALLLAIAISSCTKREIPVEPGGASIIFATIDGSHPETDTRTSLGSEGEGGKEHPILWTSGDLIAVTDEDPYGDVAKYRLTAGAGTKSGTFEDVGTSPIQAKYAYYPYSGVKSVNDTNLYTVNIPTKQVYSANSFGNGAMPMWASVSSDGTTMSFKNLMSVLKLQLKGTCKVSRIIVSDTIMAMSGEATVNMQAEVPVLEFSYESGRIENYVELECPDVQLDASVATVFYISVPASGDSTQYDVCIVTDESKVMRVSTKGITFSLLRVKPMAPLTVVPGEDVKYVEGTFCENAVHIGDTIWWAPANCGYEPSIQYPAIMAEYKGYKYGKMFQWGRRYGQGYDDGTYQDATSPSSSSGTYIGNQVSLEDGNMEANQNNFYKGDGTYLSWTTETPLESDKWFTDYNPCPKGWRVPTENEFSALTAAGSEQTSQGGISGRLFSSTLFLPAAGEFLGDSESSPSIYRGSNGYYWSSSAGGTTAKRLIFESGSDPCISVTGRAFGHSIRCVR